MTPGEWARIKSILNHALALPADARPAYVDEACGGDEALRHEVGAYLGLEQRADEIFHITAWRDAATEPEPDQDSTSPERVGAYRIVRRLGEGGMGIVYLAERDDGAYSQQVAVKVMKPGPQAAQFLARFRKERQILASLHHPYITRLVDGGTTPQGQLYYVMEHVEGQPLNGWAKERRLSVKARLQLFCQVCEAVAEAHRRLVIHRDLKPANILVTGNGTPKLLDFGLAQVFQPDAAPAATIPVLTPGYASPEQVRGEPLTTATDIYSLGVILYELLTGVSPYQTPTTSPLDTFRAVCEQEPKPPSDALKKKLPRDLDHIALMALRKEPGERYRSVDEFRADIEAHLAGLPVRATKGSLVYRTGKFIRRHRWGVSVSVAGSIAAVILVSMIWWKGRQAELRFQQVRQLAHAVVFELHDAIQDLPGSTAARKLLVERALQYLRDLEATGGANTALQLELAAAYTKIGEVQSSSGAANLGDSAGARDSHQRARRILKDVLRAEPDNDRAQEMLAHTGRLLADFAEMSGEVAWWRELRAESTALQWKRARRFPDQPAHAARALWDEAYTASAEGKLKEAIPAWQRALAAFQKLHDAEPRNAQHSRGYRRCLRNLARALQDQGKKSEALRYYQSAFEVTEAQLKADPRNTRLRMEASWDLAEMGWLEHEQKHENEAVAFYDQAMAHQRALAEADPHDFRVRLELAKLRITAAPAHDGAGRTMQAKALLEQARQECRAALARDPANDDARVHLAWGDVNLGDVLFRQQRWDEAAAVFTEALEALGQLKDQSVLQGLLKPDLMRKRASAQLAECKKRRGG